MNFTVVRLGTTVVLLAFAATLLAAQPSGEQSTQVAQQPEQQELLQELAEVVVNGEKPVKDDQQVINWLASLGGEFTLDGDVDVHGRGDPDDLQPVDGSATCVAFGIAPGIQCELHVRWAETRASNGEAILGGISTLDPAFILYGFEPRNGGIRSMLVESNGVGNRALGLLFGSTLVSKSPCVNVSGNCLRVVRTMVEPNIQIIKMQIDLEIDSKIAVRYGLTMRRVPGSTTTVIKGTTK